MAAGRRESEFTQLRPLKVLVGTFNANGKKPEGPLSEWLTCRSGGTPDVVAFGCARSSRGEPAERPVPDGRCSVARFVPPLGSRPQVPGDRGPHCSQRNLRQPVSHAERAVGTAARRRARTPLSLGRRVSHGARGRARFANAASLRATARAGVIEECSSCLARCPRLALSWGHAISWACCSACSCAARCCPSSLTWRSRPRPSASWASSCVHVDALVAPSVASRRASMS